MFLTPPKPSVEEALDGMVTICNLQFFLFFSLQIVSGWRLC